MERPNLSPLDQAYLDLPTRWYEKLSSLKHLIYYGIGIGLPIYTIIGNAHIPITTRAAIGFLYLAGRAVDQVSTKRTFVDMNKARDHNVPIIHSELNPAIRRQMETSGQITLKDTEVIVKEGIGFMVSQVNPAYSLTGTIIFCTIALSNLRIGRRYLRASELAQMQSGYSL